MSDTWRDYLTDHERSEVAMLDYQVDMARSDLEHAQSQRRDIMLRASQRKSRASTKPVDTDMAVR